MTSAESLSYTLRSLSADLYAIIHNAVEHTRAAIDTQFLREPHFTSFPIQSVGWTRFNAEPTFNALARCLIDDYDPLNEELLYVQGCQEFLPPLLLVLLLYV